MHIPDGYLSPTSCALAYAVAAPFWARGLAVVKSQMQGRAMPRLALVSAFSFTVMMFNLPIPGGTTAHAVGMAVAAILLGPWAGLVAISLALAIQALFFGDGGITAFGANALNMAVIGSFTAWWVYRLLANRAELTAPWRAFAAAAAGYVAINASALATGIEFGLQPLLFHDASGTPLYAPYPLSVAVPAMMLAHLTVAGAAEAVLTGGIVGWLQRSHPEMLEPSAAPRRSPRALWAGLAGLMLATPLGLLAAGTAWGEWAPDTLAARPAGLPSGLARLADTWQAPFPGYAPAFLHNEAAAYIASALAGGALILLAAAALGALFGRPRRG